MISKAMLAMSAVMEVILPVVALLVGLGLGALVGFLVYKSVITKKIGDTKTIVNRMIDDATLEAKTLKKEAILEAKEEEMKLRKELEAETKSRRQEMQKSEQRILQKEESLEKRDEALNKKLDSIEQQQRSLQQKAHEMDKMKEEISQSHEKMLVELEKISMLTRDEAKAMLVSNIEEEAKKDAAIMVREIERDAKENAEKRAKEIISLSIQKCAADHASDVTVSVVPLPSDDMKGRIIGREGRNIRALESATGIDLIIDDTPEVVILSGFDPVRREIARITVEKLISDGRIHPARIEETVNKVRKEVDAQIKEAGEAAMFDAGLFGLHPEIIKLLGRLKFRTSYGQNVLKHSLEVSYLAGVMAGELGADVAFARRAGLLHDLGKAVDHEVEGTHVQIGADLAKKYKENKFVVNAIAAHHGDVEPMTLEAILVSAADAISGARPGARRETLDNYVKRLTKLEEIADSFKGVDKSFAISAGREVRVIVKPEAIDDAQTLFLAKDIAKKIESELEYPGQIKVSVIREMRSVEYAK